MVIKFSAVGRKAVKVIYPDLKINQPAVPVR